jgi:uncharacterized protein (TIGR03437 family)
MPYSLMRAAIFSLLLLPPANAQTTPVRHPQGVYSFFIVDLTAGAERTANPSITSAQLHAYMQKLYATALNNPAVSGLALDNTWSTLNPNPPSDPQPYDLSWLDDAFSTVAGWNAKNPSKTPKTIMLGINSGFNSPQWVLNQIPSCDGLFLSPAQTPSSNCGTATFNGFVEGNGGVLPLPWDGFYKTSLATFLTAVAAQYGTNPALVSISITGPTAASTEMIMPNDKTSQVQTEFGLPIEPNNMWLKLLSFAYPTQPTYQKSDQFLIDAWNSAIDSMGQIFNGLTLAVWTGDGFPNLATTGFSIPPAFAGDCPVANMDCATETTILSHLADPTVAAANGKSTGEAGVRGFILTGPSNLTADSARMLAQRTLSQTSPAAQILAGDQFATSTAVSPAMEGCTVRFPVNPADTPAGCVLNQGCSTAGCQPVACIPQACLAPGITQADLVNYDTYSEVPAKDLISAEQAMFNALTTYFNNTPAAPNFNGTAGISPENYLQIYNGDFVYAAAHATPVPVQAGTTTVSATMQNILNLASQQLLAISEPAPVITKVANAEGESPLIAPNTWVEIKGENLAMVGFDRIWGASDIVNSAMPTALNGVSATVNGKSAYVYYVSPAQVNILTPPSPISGQVQVTLTTNGLNAAFTAQALAAAPSFFVFNGGPYIAATHLNGSLIGPATLYPGASTPATPGETIVLYANGFGPTSTLVTSGSVTQSGTLSPLPVITMGGVPATVAFAGLVAPGEFQFNVVVPSTLANGDQSILATYNSQSTQSNTLITIATAQVGPQSR